MEFIQ
jgi:serine/threonine protein kinase